MTEPLQDGIYVVNEFRAIALDKGTRKMFTAPEGDPKKLVDPAREKLDLEAVKRFYDDRLEARGKLTDIVRECGIYVVEPGESWVSIDGGSSPCGYEAPHYDLAYLIRAFRGQIPFCGLIDGDRQERSPTRLELLVHVQEQGQRVFATVYEEQGFLRKP